MEDSTLASHKRWADNRFVAGLTLGRLSVCHTPVLCRNGCTYHRTSSLSDSHTVLVSPYETLWQYSDGDPLSETLNEGAWKRRPISRFISETIQDGAIVTTEHQWELVRNLSSGAISNYLAWSWERNIQWHGASRGISATAEIHLDAVLFCANKWWQCRFV